MQIFSTHVKKTLKKIFIHLIGIFLCAFGALALVGTIAYDPSDGSLNTTSAFAQNSIKNFTAYYADFTLQGLGIGGILFTFTILTWGYRLGRYGYLNAAGVRVILLCISLVLITTGSTPFDLTLPYAHTIPLQGVVGLALWNMVSPVFMPYTTVVAVMLILLASVLYLYAVAIEPKEWKYIFHTLLRITKAGIKILLYVVRYVYKRRKEKSLQKKQVEPTLERQRGNRGKNGKSSTAEPAVKKNRKVQPRRVAVEDEFELPPISLLNVGTDRKKSPINREEQKNKAKNLEKVLGEFGVKGHIKTIRSGPVVTTYELEPAPGVRTSRIINLTEDIARTMSAQSVRISSIPGKTVIGIEMPNTTPEIVVYRDLIDSKSFTDTPLRLPIILGKTIEGGGKVSDLAAMPHLLIAGTTGSGKSVGLNAMILSFLFKYTPEQLRLIMVDPKMLEFSMYEDIPHLLCPVVTDPKKAVFALKWAVREMENRYRAMSKIGVRNIEGYNQKMQEAKRSGQIITDTVQMGFDDEGNPIFEEQPHDLSTLPYIVVIVDEMADLMLVAGKDIEASIQRLAQMARAAGIHLIMATQRPSVDVITGTIKANFPTRISYMVTSKIDSRTILGEQGAEQLLGRGDLLIMESGGRITRHHAPFVQDNEVQAVCDWLRAQKYPQYIQSITDETESSDPYEEEKSTFTNMDATVGNGEQQMYDQAVTLVARTRKASISYIQRSLKIGYNRAANIVEKMEEEGVVSPANHVGKRQVLAPKREY